MPHTTVKLSAARWSYLKALGYDRPRYIHVSASISWVNDPLTRTQRPVCHRRDRRLPPAPGMVGVTFVAGRRDAKRERSVARAVRRRNRHFAKTAATA